MTDQQGPSAPPTDWLSEAIAVANLPALTCVLLQMTGDRRWIEEPFVPTRTRGMDDNDDGGFPQVVREEIRAAAKAVLEDWFAGQPVAIPNPSDELLLEMMSVSLGEKVPPEYAPMIRQELQLDSEGNQLPGELRAGTVPPPGFTAIIIGAGISGLCAAISFEAAGIPVVIVERRDEVGGVWLDNRYPGAACDVPSHLYSFSFAPFSWSRYFADSREINRYLEEVADRYNVRRHIRFGLEAKEARYDEQSRTWSLEVEDRSGRRTTLCGNILVSGVGAFNKPSVPQLPGMETFGGSSFHTAHYPDEGLDLSGKDVVLVGSGASAMQVAPAIADEVGSLKIVQRTPQWAAPFPKFGVGVPEPLQRLLDSVPLYRRWYRLRLSWAFNDKLYSALQVDLEWEGDGRSINAINDSHRRHLTAYIQSELGEAQELLPEVLPTYPPFSKRMLLDNGWFRTIARDNVELVRGKVVSVERDGVVTDDDRKLKADVLIWATGFDVVHWLAPMRVTGIGGRDLHEDWEGDNARAYLGTVVPGYPNFFCLYGPNTQFGHGGSLITVLERQVHYIMSLLSKMFEHGLAVVDVLPERYEEYNARIDERHSGMVWATSGVKTYFHNSKGRVVVNNPFRILEVWNLTEEADLRDYRAILRAEDDTKIAAAGEEREVAAR